MQLYSTAQWHLFSGTRTQASGTSASQERHKSGTMSNEIEPIFLKPVQFPFSHQQNTSYIYRIHPSHIRLRTYIYRIHPSHISIYILLIASRTGLLCIRRAFFVRDVHADIHARLALQVSVPTQAAALRAVWKIAIEKRLRTVDVWTQHASRPSAPKLDDRGMVERI